MVHASRGRRPPDDRGGRLPVAIIAGVLTLASCSGATSGAAGPRPTVPSATAASSATPPPTVGPLVTPPPTTTPPLPTTTTTTVDPGTLPQTRDRPSDTDAQFVARMQLVFQAVRSGDAAVGLPAFFPLSAYLQVKTLADPAADWHNRLIAQYDGDIAGLHAVLGAEAASARFVGVSVPSAAATWVDPGAEYNRIGYWRVYDSTVEYAVGASPRSFTVISLISWRGQWYVVHFRTPPR
jgi:hypothetical protein